MNRTFIGEPLEKGQVALRVLAAARPEKRLYGDDAPYVPVNFITAEVYSMIAAWESCETKRMESEAGAVESDRKVYHEALYQPHRYAHGCATQAILS
jgi:hypothetical protein